MVEGGKLDESCVTKLEDSVKLHKKFYFIIFLTKTKCMHEKMCT